MKRIKRVIAIFTPEELLQFFTVKDGVWHVDCRGLPDDYKVISMSYDPESNQVRFLLETDTDGRFFEVPRGCSPPEANIFRKVDLIGSINSNPSSQCTPVFAGFTGDDV